MAHGGSGLLDDAAGLPGDGQVGGDVDEAGRADQVGADGGHDGLDVVGALGLGGIVRAVVVGNDARPVVGGTAGDGVADADAAADAGNQHRAAGQGERVAAAAVGVTAGVVRVLGVSAHNRQFRGTLATGRPPHALTGIPLKEGPSASQP